MGGNKDGGDGSATPGDSLVGFGEHRDKTYDQLLREDPGYCSWVLQRYGEDEQPSPSLSLLAEWLKFQGFEDSADASTPSAGTGESLVGFGQHRDMTYEDAMTMEPDYCEWVLRTYEEDDDPKPALVAFAEWLQSEGFEVRSQDDGDESAPHHGRLRVGFGKHRDLTYEEIVTEDPDYCDWIIRTYEEDPDEAGFALRNLAQWLLEQGHVYPSKGDTGGGASDNDGSSRKVGFGRHGSLTYEEALEEDADYCRWVLDTYHNNEDDPSPALEAFARWLEEKGFPEEEEE
jgi:hypothetical protein